MRPDTAHAPARAAIVAIAICTAFWTLLALVAWRMLVQA